MIPMTRFASACLLLRPAIFLVAGVVLGQAQEVVPDSSPLPAGPPAEASSPIAPTLAPVLPEVVPAPLAPVVARPQPEPTVRLTFPSTSVNEILSLYEVLTDKRLIRDSALSAGQPLTIMVPGEVPQSEAIRLIEASLLLNGYSFVPVDEKTAKVLGPSKFPRAEGIPIYSTPYMLPDSDQVVSYFMKFDYLAPTEAAQLFQTFISPPKAYTAFTPVPNVQAVLITENVPVIQNLIALKAMVDVPPAQVMTEFITLKRADAEKVAEVLQGLLEQRDAKAVTASSRPPQGGQPAQGSALQNQLAQASQASSGAAQFESNLVAGETQIVADPRTNRILVVTRPVNFPYIQKLIRELDAPVPLDAVLERSLQFVAATDVLPVLSDLLSDGEETEGTTGSGGGESRGSALERSTGQGAGSRNSGSGGGIGAADRLSEPDGNAAPESVIIGKTKIIADNSSNSIIVIGPPDSREKASQLLDMLDVRPRQVYISAVIGQLNLSDDMEFGLSYFLRYQGDGGTGAAGTILNSLFTGGTSTTNPSDLIRPELFTQALSGLSVYGTIADSVDIYARALESTGKFKILSRPVIYTTNNKKAVISSGQEIPYTSSAISSVNGGINGNSLSSNITYKDILLKLEVVPLINSNKEVTLVIAQTNNNLLGEEEFGNGNKAPIISAQELTTTVTVPSGGTVVLGGLITETMEADDSGVPFIMRVPVLGYLFKKTVRKVLRTELLILLQPTVVENNEELAEVSWQERYRSKLGDEAYASAAAPAFANTPVIFSGDELKPDSEIRKPRDPLRPAGWDYQEYAPTPSQRPQKTRETLPSTR